MTLPASTAGGRPFGSFGSGEPDGVAVSIGVARRSVDPATPGHSNPRASQELGERLVSR